MHRRRFAPSQDADQPDHDVMRTGRYQDHPPKNFAYSHEVLTVITPYQFAASQVFGAGGITPHSAEWSTENIGSGFLFGKSPI